MTRGESAAVTSSRLVSHRRGRRTSLLAPQPRKVAPMVALLAAAANREAAREAACSAQVTVLTDGGQVTVPAVELHGSGLVDQLLPVRRPPSYRGMRNFIGRLPVPPLETGRSVWFESLNERAHLRDMLLCDEVAAVATQPMLVSWSLPDGVRRHVPDVLVARPDGSWLVCDVTRREKLTRPAVVAQLMLMAATAAVAGWTFEVRTEMPAQRVANQAFVAACRVPPVSAELLAGVFAGVAARVLPVREVAAALARHARPGLDAVWASVASRQLFVDYDLPLTLDTQVSLDRLPESRPWVLPR